MATGQKILDRIRNARSGDQEKRGVLPLFAFYGGDKDRERSRNRMYHEVALVMAMRPDEEEDLAATAARFRTDRVAFFGIGEKLAIIDVKSSPLEFLVARGEMERDGDEQGMGGARFHTALRIRDLIDGAQVRALRSPSLEGAGGGGGSSAGDIRGYQLDCIRLLRRVKEGMPSAWVFDLMEGVVWRDDWFDLKVGEGTEKAKREVAKDRTATIAALHFALDRAGVTLNYVPAADFTQRWGEQLPALPPEVRRRIRASTAAGRLSLQT